MDSKLRNLAGELVSSAPCSVELPAGTGKTHLLAAAVAVAAEAGKRALVLTHTNAGVDAIRSRLLRFDVPPSAVRVDTITGWAFTLVRAYSTIAGISVPDSPDWNFSADYVHGAQRVACSTIGATLHKQSFDYLFVDEYQDCTVDQDAFVKAMSADINRVVVLGDRLQAIFGFAGTLVDWSTHVVPAFPNFNVEWEPHRWNGYNPLLGDWLLSLREELVDGGTIDFSTYDIEGLSLVGGDPSRQLSRIAWGFREPSESVLVLDKWHWTVAAHASRLSGSFAVMEDIQGNYMQAALKRLPPPGDPQLATWLARFSKDCASGLAGLDRPLLNRLMGNQSIGSYRRQGLEQVIEALETVRVDPTYVGLVKAATEIQRSTSVKLYRREAWRDTLQAIALCEDSDLAPPESLAKVRDRLRWAGRRPPKRVASRTLLVKGLEFDHVVIADLSNFSDPRDLYVALSRSRRTLTLLGRNHRIQLAFDRGTSSRRRRQLEPT